MSLNSSLNEEMFQTNVLEKIKTRILCSMTSRKSYFMKNRTFMRKWRKKYGTSRQVTADIVIRRMRFACGITEATDKHSEYVIIIAFPLKQWLQDGASMLRNTYSGCLGYELFN